MELATFLPVVRLTARTTDRYTRMPTATRQYRHTMRLGKHTPGNYHRISANSLRYRHAMRPESHTPGGYYRTPAPDQRQPAHQATTQSHRGRIPRNSDGHSTLSARRVTAKVAQQTDTSRIQHQDGDICPPCAHAVAPRADGRLQATDRQPPASIRDLHDDNKERPASNNYGRPEPIIAPDAHHPVPLTDTGSRPASTQLLLIPSRNQAAARPGQACLSA